MQTRREFLVSAGRALGGWFVGAELARRILRLARERQAPYLIKVPAPERILWANPYGDGDFVLTLDLPWSESGAPELTWEDWFETREVDWKNPDQVRKHLIEWGCYEPEDEEAPFVCPRLKDLLPEDLQRYYEENDYSLAQWPTARAYRYLSELDLEDHPEAGPDPLGALEFIDGCCPGNDTYLVQARGVETLGGLQQRLLQLGQGVAVRLNKRAL